MALKRVWIPSPNYSSRGGATVRLIVLHTAEGARTYQSLGSFFGSSSSGVSSQVGIDDTLNTVGEYVARGNKAWTQGNANPVSTSAEMCAFAAWSASEWSKHQVMLENTATWIAEEATAFKIPIVRLNASQAQGSGRGVCQHIDLGSWGGGHVDCGPAFPMNDVLNMAIEIQNGSGGLPDVNGGPPVPFIKSNDGKTYWFIANGPKSYWRQVPDGLVSNIPTGMIINDANGSWRALWQVGAPK
jgi:N-acetylmuramoyl-L-alanine amidase